MIHPRYLEFEPIARASGWTLEDGSPRIWWWAHLHPLQKLTLSDGTNAGQMDTAVSIRIGNATPLGKTPYRGAGAAPDDAKWGYLSITRDESEMHVHLFLSKDEFDRLMASFNSLGPPTLQVGFGPAGPFDELKGPIIDDEHHRWYRWNIAAESIVPLEAYEIVHTRAAPESSLTAPDETPRVMRIAGAGFAVVTNLLALLVALAMFGVASTQFETAVVSVLLLIYLNVVTSSTAHARALQDVDFRSLARFLALREQVGGPKISEGEEKYLDAVRKGLSQPGAAYWIGTVSNAIIALVAIYKLLGLLM